ncbi:rod shape-determining protein RodA [Crocinitomicaceae bacterium CZZ-1]|uniref:Cell wall polymerase n=1 Tax=Taishania pollutisoli TaxID=2766479 RepID=A0A8J6PC95_9FLAO|nr:rod shape-determining protein RodA [Taishania pollutisoli]MBC9812493.1 rod shape-determining protein RodA [Taishania pollutisoli]
MRQGDKLTSNIDWPILLVYFLILGMGLMTVYSTAYDAEHPNILDFSMLYGRQVMWIGVSLFLGLVVFLIDSEIYRKFSIPIYIGTLMLLVVVLFTPPINGARAWLGVGSFGIQPAEFAKIGTAILLANYINRMNIKQQNVKNVLTCLAIIIIPMGLIILQPDAGTFVVFTSFFFVLYREGITFDPIVLSLINLIPGVKFKQTWIGTHFIPLLFIIVIISVVTLLLSKTTFDLAFVGLYELPSIFGIIAAYFIIGLLFYVVGRTIVGNRNKRRLLFIVILSFSIVSFLSASISTVFSHLKQHQKNRIELLLGLNEEDQRDGDDYNRNRAMTAVGSGGLTGKGYKKATLASVESNHVPESETDFIFCPFAEEWGFVGTSVLMGLYLFLLLRIVYIAERQRSVYNRVYAYSVGMILFYHFAINIGMNIGLAPVIGIPLPFFSYGGSSMMSFSAMFFILLKLDSQRRDTLF